MRIFYSIQLVGTVHGNQLNNLVKNPVLSDLIGGIQSVTLGDEMNIIILIFKHSVIFLFKLIKFKYVIIKLILRILFLIIN